MRLRYNISSLYLPVLRKVVEDHHYSYQASFDYSWASRKDESPVTMRMNRRPLAASLAKDGVRNSFDVETDGS